jgi:hypothetical protein
MCDVRSEFDRVRVANARLLLRRATAEDLQRWREKWSGIDPLRWRSGIQLLPADVRSAWLAAVADIAVSPPTPQPEMLFDAGEYDVGAGTETR